MIGTRTAPGRRPVRDDPEAYSAFRRAFWLRWRQIFPVQRRGSFGSDRQEMRRWACLRAWWGVEHLGDVPLAQARAATRRLRAIDPEDFDRAVRRALEAS